MNTKLHFRSGIFFSFLFIIFSLLKPNYFYSQTKGIIYEPATGAGATVLDPNGDGYVSQSQNGFISDDQAESEIPFTSFAFNLNEPNSDLNIGSNCGYADFVDQGDRDAAQKYLSSANNWLFRLRLGAIAPNSKSYSILVDADGLFGKSGANADPHYTIDNPGFEFEIVLATGSGVSIYNVNTANPSCTPAINYSGHTNYQKSIALSTECGDLDYFLDFYVPFSDIQSIFPSLTTGSGMRYVIVSNVEVNKSSICSPSTIADIAGYSTFSSYSYAYTELINSQGTCSPSESICTLRSDCPNITTPIQPGATSISGTSTEIGGTITIYINGSAVGTTNVDGTGNWNFSGFSPALNTNDIIYAKAISAGESSSLSDCNTYTVNPCSGTPVAAPTVSNITGKNLCGTGLPGYDIQVTYPNGTIFAANPTTSLYLPVPTNGQWVWKCTGNTGNCNAGSGVDCIQEGGYIVYQVSPNGCKSSPSFICNNIAGGYTPQTSLTPTISTSSVFQGSTSVNVTISLLPGPSPQNGYIHLFVNDQPFAVSNAVTTSGVHTVSCSPLPACSSIKAYFIQSGSNGNGDCYSLSSTSIQVLNGSSNTPRITGNYCISGNLSSVTGISDEANGTSIQLFVNGTPAGSPGTVNNGYWSITGLNIAPGSTITATAQASCKSVSGLSSSVVVNSLSSNASLSLTTNPVIEQSTSLSGTGVNGTQVKVFVDGVQVGSPVSVSGGTWSLNGIQSYELFPGGFITLTSTSGGSCQSSPVNGSSIVCNAPSSNLNLDPANIDICTASDTATITVNNTQPGVIYQLYLANGTTTTGNSLLGTGSNITLTSGLISANTTLKVKGIKLPQTCETLQTDNVPLTVNALPSISATTPASRCGTGTVVLGATASAGTINWYAASTGGASLGTGTSFTTPSISTTTTYYVDATTNGCTTGTRTAVVATVNAIPTITATTPASRCGTGTVVLGATASAGTINWYSASTGGTSIATGTSYTTPSISATTTYYVDATASGCTSGTRTAIVASVNAIPSIIGTLATCVGSTTTLSGSGTPNASSPWVSSNTSVATINISGLVAALSVGNTTITYIDNNGCSTNSTITISSAPILTAPTSSSICNSSSTNLSVSCTQHCPGLTYNWAPATGLSSTTTQNVTATPSANTLYTVTATNANGCSSASVYTVIVNPTPVMTSGTNCCC